MTERKWTDDMGEISGFGGSYEEGCRAMVLAGIKWLEENPDKKPEFVGYKGIYGIIKEENDAAKEMTKAMMDAEVFMEEEGKMVRCGDHATGAMHQATVNHALRAHANGWEWYCEQMRKREENDAET